MTEDEAKTRWCPLARIPFIDRSVAGVALAAVNAFKMNDEPEKRTNCIGSACMMWRDSLDYFIRDGNPEPRMRTEPQVIGGYCGLAGQPSPSALAAGMPLGVDEAKLKPRAIGNGVYSRPQPGDKTDIGSGG